MTAMEIKGKSLTIDIEHTFELTDAEIGAAFRAVHDSGFDYIKLNREAGPPTDLNTNIHPEKKEGGHVNINLNTLANCVTAVCAVIIAWKVI